MAEVEQSQNEGMRQLAQGLAAAVEDAEASLQRSVHAESRRSLDALHRLPALLAATLPVTDVTPLSEEEEGGADMRLLPQRQRQQLLPGGLAPADRAWLQELLSAAMERATAQSYRDQVHRPHCSLVCVGLKCAEEHVSDVTAADNVLVRCWYYLWHALLWPVGNSSSLRQKCGIAHASCAGGARAACGHAVGGAGQAPARHRGRTAGEVAKDQPLS